MRRFRWQTSVILFKVPDISFLLINTWSSNSITVVVLILVKERMNIFFIMRTGFMVVVLLLRLLFGRVSIIPLIIKIWWGSEIEASIIP